MPAPTLYGKGDQPRESIIHDREPLVGGHLCLDFVNTVDRHGDVSSRDALSPGYVNVLAWFVQAGVVDEATEARLLRVAGKEPREAAATRKRTVAFRDALYTVVIGLISSAELDPDALALVNAEIQRAHAAGSYERVDSVLEWQWRGAAELEQFLWPVAREAAVLLSSTRMTKIRQCAAPTCENLFLDTSKNGSRQFCSSATCGNAARIRRFRERQKSAT